jgi:acetyltransferase
MNQNHNDNQRARHQLEALFAPRSIAVIGASASPAKLGSVMLRSLASFPGALYPIHPRETVIGGYTPHHS